MGSAIAFAPPAIALCPADLPAAIETIASQPELQRARLGIQVETLAGEVVYSREGDRFFVPASTLKLLTTAAVLTALGPDFTIRTSVYQLYTSDDSTTLAVVGQGDPSFDTTDLDNLVSQITTQEMRQVFLLGYEEAFVGDPVNPNWDWEDVQAGYGAPVNALILNENKIGLSLVPQAIGEPLQVVWDDPDQEELRWRIENRSRTVAPGEPEFVSVGRDLTQRTLRVEGQLAAGAEPETAAIAVVNPGLVFLSALSDAFSRQGIESSNAALALQDSFPRQGPEIAAVQSPPLAELLIPTNQDSNNLYAEALLKQLGYQTAPGINATEAGIAAVLDILQTLGLNPDDVVMVDGSGLARKNLITPAAMVDVLQGMARSPDASTYRDSLAVAGVSGTLQNRFRDTPVAGRLWGKSGAISRNFALAGYLEPENQDPLAFSIFINNIDEPGRTARSIIDEIVLYIAALEDCA